MTDVSENSRASGVIAILLLAAGSAAGLIAAR